MDIEVALSKDPEVQSLKQDILEMLEEEEQWKVEKKVKSLERKKKQLARLKKELENEKI